MANPSKTENEKIAPIIIKRVKKYGGGHHGGAWKVAYADFVTAMMAFFLLLWLLNVTTEQQKNAISNYFDPSHPIISDSVSGSGGVMGGTSVVSEGAMSSMVQSIARPEVPSTTKIGQKAGEFVKNENTGDKEKEEAEKIAEDLKKAEEQKFELAKKQLEAELEKSPDLQELKKNLLIDITPEGLRIQIVDDQGRSMFARGAATMLPFMEKLVVTVGGVIASLPNQISIRGHTDGAPYKTATGYDNWNLSADRAQATRRVLVNASKLPETRIENVVGRADREHLLPSDPLSERNRRISIILLREDYAGKAQHIQKQQKDEAAKKKQAETLQIGDDTSDRQKMQDIHDEAVARAERLTQPPSGEDKTKPVSTVGDGAAGLKGRTMEGVVSSSKRGAILPFEDDTQPLEEAPPPEPDYINPTKPAPTKVLQFD